MTSVSPERRTFPGAFLRTFHLFTIKADYAYDHGMPQWMARVDHLRLRSTWSAFF